VSHHAAIFAPSVAKGPGVNSAVIPPLRQSAGDIAPHHLAEINSRADRLIAAIERSRARELARRWGHNAALGLQLPVLA
jgi:hypothetical protein